MENDPMQKPETVKSMGGGVICMIMEIKFRYKICPYLFNGTEKPQQNINPKIHIENQTQACGNEALTLLPYNNGGHKKKFHCIVVKYANKLTYR